MTVQFFWQVCLCCHGLVHFVKAQHLSSSAACLCSRCSSKLVVLLPLLVTDFKHTLQRGVVCSVSDATKPNQFQITDDTTCAFLGNEFFPARMLFVYLSNMQWGCQDVFFGVAREGPATSLGWHRNLLYFNIKMWLPIKYWTVLVPQRQLNKIDFY